MHGKQQRKKALWTQKSHVQTEKNPAFYSIQLAIRLHSEEGLKLGNIV